MNVKMLRALTARMSPKTEMVLVMKPAWPQISDDFERALERCVHSVTNDMELQEGDVLLAEVEGHAMWLVARVPD
jgi:hypothetical protein